MLTWTEKDEQYAANQRYGNRWSALHFGLFAFDRRCDGKEKKQTRYGRTSVGRTMSAEYDEESSSKREWVRGGRPYGLYNISRVRARACGERNSASKGAKRFVFTHKTALTCVVRGLFSSTVLYIYFDFIFAFLLHVECIQWSLYWSQPHALLPRFSVEYFPIFFGSNFLFIFFPFSNLYIGSETHYIIIIRLLYTFRV